VNYGGKNPEDPNMKPPKEVLTPLEVLKFYVSKVTGKGDRYENDQTDHKNSNIAIP
jgi:hypothetical protein